MPPPLDALARKICSCRRCPRLVAHREAVAREPPRRYLGQPYWARPLPGFGDPSARLFVLGLAPAAHGGNRTGRVFTGDNSGLWLYRALHDAGFANQSGSVSKDDGLTLNDAWVSVTVRCAPPGNKPLPEELATCAPYLHQELQLLPDVKVVLALGLVAWRGYLSARRALGRSLPRPLPIFGHGAAHRFEDDGVLLLGSFHPSQQNTFTGRLTRPMFDALFEQAKAALDPSKKRAPRRE